MKSDGERVQVSPEVTACNRKETPSYLLDDLFRVSSNKFRHVEHIIFGERSDDVVRTAFGSPVPEGGEDGSGGDDTSAYVGDGEGRQDGLREEGIPIHEVR